MKKLSANLISYLFHPLLLPSTLFVLLIFYLPEALQPMSGKVMFYVLLLIFITTFIIPVFSLLGLRTTGAISDFKLQKRGERVLPFFFITVFYGLTTFLFNSKIQVNDILMSVFVGSTLVVAIITLITLFYKISVHSAGAGCMVGYFFGFTRIYSSEQLIMVFAGIILLTGAILSSRLYLNAHSPKEVYFGLVLGFIISYSTLMFLS